MSFSVFLNTSNAANVTFANNTYTFKVALRNLIPPERLNTKYKMRFAATSASLFFLNDQVPYYANIELQNAIIDTQFNGTRKPYFWMNTEAGTAGARFVVRAYDNEAVVIRSLGEVYTINMQIWRGYNTAIGASCLSHFILSFEPFDE